jgi:DNA topoisomerase-2
MTTASGKKLTGQAIDKTLNQLIEARAWQAAIYANVKVKYNGKLIKVPSFKDACQMFIESDICCTKLVNQKTNKYPWDVCIGISDHKAQQISFINGLTFMGGPHITFIQSLLVDHLRSMIDRELTKSGVRFNKNLLLNNLFIIVRGNIPDIDPEGQTKESFKYSLEKFAGYDFNPSSIKSIWQLIKPIVIASFLKSNLGETKLRTNRGRIDVPKYTEARLCRNPKRFMECCLVITEGDSATGTVNTGLLCKASPDFNYDYYGTFSIQGVSINGLKESIEQVKTKKTRAKKATDDSDTASVVSDMPTKRQRARSLSELNIPTQHIPRVPNQKLLDNERMKSLIKILGLDFNKTYETDKEFSTLRYGSVAVLVDQDLDGFNIFGLLATLFITYWPALVKRGFVRRINTPLIRYYPKNKANLVKEFFTFREAKDWIDEVGIEYVEKTYKLPPNYYKGLGSHDKLMGEVKNMFKNINNKICTYQLDEDAIKSMYIYYGDDTQPRKIVLSTPVDREPVVGLNVPLSQQFHIDTKLYQRDNTIRKLLSMIDGFVISRRKVFYTARKYAINKIKVAGLASEAVNRANYHHGESSLEDTIVRMAQAYPCARNLPLLLPIGEFGTRDMGFKNAAQSRYIYTMVNARLANKLFRKEDDSLLQYDMEEGEYFEPRYYVPIIPYVLCENEEIPATGWKITMHARDVSSILENTKLMVEGKINKCNPLPMNKLYFKGEIRKYKGKEYSVGKVTYDEKEDAIHITELPIGKYSNSFLKGSDKKSDDKKGIMDDPYVLDCKDETTMDGVDITIYLKPGAFEEIESKYGDKTFNAIEDYFDLKTCINHHINLINQNGEVIEYTNYEDVFDDWYKFRKDLYAKRVDRELILNDLEIRMLESQQRFSEEHEKYKIDRKTPIEKANAILHREKYPVFNKTTLNNPKYTQIELLIDQITNPAYGATYDYLLDMGYKDLLENAYDKRNKAIQDLLERQKFLRDHGGMFKGAKIWLQELDELELAIREGQASNWFYGTNQYKFEDSKLSDTADEPKKRIRRTRTKK